MIDEERMAELERKVADLERIVGAMTTALEPSFPDLEAQHVAFVARIREQSQGARE